VDADHVRRELVDEELHLPIVRGHLDLAAFTAQLHAQEVVDLGVAVHHKDAVGHQLLDGLVVLRGPEKAHEIDVIDDVSSGIGHEGGLDATRLDVIHHVLLGAAQHLSGLAGSVNVLRHHLYPIIGIRGARGHS
jgi:hypothetical protein